MASHYRLGLDIGGTFTDFVLTDSASGEIYRYKHLTSYPDPADGVIDGLRALLADQQIDGAQIDEIVHSTTLVTNAIIDRRGARAGLLTSAGFRHVLDLGKEQRYDAYDLFITYPDPLIPDDLRREIPERTLADGDVLTPVDEDAVLAAVEELLIPSARRPIESLAIVFLHAYANPANEEAAARVIARHFPDLPLSLSSQVAPVVGEWDRTSTTAADAYVRPLLSRYLNRLQNALAALNFRGRFAVMLSNGAASVDTAQRFPIRLLESGPSAGALAAREWAATSISLICWVSTWVVPRQTACLIEGGALPERQLRGEPRPTASARQVDCPSRCRVWT
ncbi:MAG: hydantoinase/oxoprolinase family protein [Caldilineaceae bacterium]